MASTSKQLGQATPATATAATIYTVPSATQVVGMVLFVCNTDTADHVFGVFQDDNGSTYDDTSALYLGTNIAASTTVVIAIGPMSTSGGTIGVKTDDTSSSLTFTLNGTELT